MACLSLALSFNTVAARRRLGLGVSSGPGAELPVVGENGVGSLTTFLGDCTLTKAAVSETEQILPRLLYKKDTDSGAF